jgi:hypothetical protein
LGLKTVFLSPNKGANQTSSPEKAQESMGNEKNPPQQTTLLLWMTIYLILTFSGNFSESMQTRSCPIL